jgi:hypothetical protein
MAGAGNQTAALLADRASGIELWSKTKGGRLPARRSASKKFTTYICLVSFMDYHLGYFDLETRVLEPLENPFGPKVLPM